MAVEKSLEQQIQDEDADILAQTIAEDEANLCLLYTSPSPRD